MRDRRELVVTIWATMAAFLALLAVLAWRLGAGQDPALSGHRASAARPARRVLLRRIYERKVIVYLPPSAPARRASSSQKVSGGPGPLAYAPVTRTS